MHGVDGGTLETEQLATAPASYPTILVGTAVSPQLARTCLDVMSSERPARTVKGPRPVQPPAELGHHRQSPQQLLNTGRRVGVTDRTQARQ
jgi:hypothetical protein